MELGGGANPGTFILSREEVRHNVCFLSSLLCVADKKRLRTILQVLRSNGDRWPETTSARLQGAGEVLPRRRMGGLYMLPGEEGEPFRRMREHPVRQPLSIHPLPERRMRSQDSADWPPLDPRLIEARVCCGQAVLRRLDWMLGGGWLEVQAPTPDPPMLCATTLLSARIPQLRPVALVPPSCLCAGARTRPTPPAARSTPTLPPPSPSPTPTTVLGSGCSSGTRPAATVGATRSRHQHAARTVIR